MDFSTTSAIHAMGSVQIDLDRGFQHRDDTLGATETAALVVRAQAGDRAAFDRLMILHQRLVMGIALRVLRNKDDARDAAQEVFLKLYRNLCRIKSNADLKPWLYRVTVNACHDLASKRNHLSATSLDDENAQARDFPGVTAGAQGEMELQERRRLIQQALQALPFKERAAIVLRDVEGLSTAETAVILGTREATVRSQIASARVKIKRYCERAIGRGR